MFMQLSEAAEWQPMAPFAYFDYMPGSTSFLCGGAISVGDRAVFFADDGIHGCEMWVLSSVNDEPQLLKDICPGECSVDMRDLRYLGDRMFFRAKSGTGTFYQLWVTDGTPEGTYQVAELSDGDPKIQSIQAAGDYVYFNADDGVHGTEIWRTDGTEAGTYMLADTNDGPEERPGFDIVDMGSFLLFRTWTVQYGTELWRSDGTPSNAYMVTEILPGSQSSGVSMLTRYGEIALFRAYIAPFDLELWKTDGTAEGTVLVKEINDAPGLVNIKGSSPNDFTVLGNTVLFSATTNLYGTELWRTDGTSVGTWMVKDIDPRPYNLLEGSSRPSFLQRFRDRVLFHAYDGVTTTEVWMSDGTEAGTVPLTDSVDDGTTLLNSFYQSNGFFYLANAGFYMRFDAAYALEILAESPPPGVSLFGMTYLDGVLLMQGESTSTGKELYALNIPPWVEFITPETASPTDLQEASFIVRFNEAVEGVTPGDFTLSGSGIFEPAVIGTEAVGEGREWRVTVDTGAGDGTLYLRLNDDNSIVDAFGGLPLEGYGIADGSFAGETGLVVDKAAPTVMIATTGPNPTLDAPIPVQVTFERPVTGVSAQDFLIGNATLDNFTGSGADYSFDLTPLDFGEVTAQVPPNICVDAGQVPNAPSNVLVVQFEAPPEFHTADTTQDRLINLSELLRVVQFFNAHLVTGNPEGMFYCDPEEKEDGYLLLPAGAHQDCAPHASDYKPQDWRINLSELLRVIQFFNSAGYHWCNDAAKEGDGYCAGPGEG
jgi:ELWxxDGT repeat protein